MIIDQFEWVNISLCENFSRRNCSQDVRYKLLPFVRTALRTSSIIKVSQFFVCPNPCSIYRIEKVQIFIFRSRLCTQKQRIITKIQHSDGKSPTPPEIKHKWRNKSTSILKQIFHIQISSPRKIICESYGDQYVIRTSYPPIEKEFCTSPLGNPWVCCPRVANWDACNFSSAMSWIHQKSWEYGSYIHSTIQI